MNGRYRLADLTWPEVRDRAAAGALLAIPVGATEQHGPHLPLSTDSDIAVTLCERLARSRADVLVAPAVAYGSSGEHAGFAGTLSIGQAATELLLLELGRSACETFARVVFVSAHGGNAESVARAVDRLRAESRDVRAFAPQWHGDPHAGRTETALMLTVRPLAVRDYRAIAGNTRPLPELLPQLRSCGVRAVSDTGILGNPAGATSTEGSALLDRLVSTLSTRIERWNETAAA
ncbi:mycofactocin biosynthesis peptidyl-dipeptidase MftE [Nocardia blacklockiae]|uniref:mycofactocin biosynthesis peptidyl-dipeptidase MftE n=1 Tax=Nocardia blacklockiae TaxID=480036 RepID=UPI001894F98C|nr:mycofactocin biosynthesis peptidyl-dipeptidase MftE [Nocardia blacklockiae]MBF6169995.1 mycofactocin biosynthesis peptidyl-dipeptidase MftE [Nocardia blacklockiae]